MKFQVGDKVKVVEVFDTKGSHRAKEIGKILTIQNVNHMGLDCYPRKGINYYAFDDGETDYIFYEDELELAPFTKSDLKDGMVVELRKGRKALFLNNTFMTECNTWLSLKDYNENLTYSSQNSTNSPYDICKVFNSEAVIIDDIFKNNKLNLIWERPKEEPTKKMTVEEIEKELGYKVEIVSDKAEIVSDSDDNWLL